MIQGESHAQVFLDRVKFDAMVRAVKSERLSLSDDVLAIDDPVKPRRDAKDFLKSIFERLDRVQEDELEKAGSVMTPIIEAFGTNDIDDEDIEDMVEKIVEFYSTAEDVKMPPKYDKDLFDYVKKYSKSTSQAIKEIVNAQKTDNALDCILAFSQDPIRRVERLAQLVEKVNADILKVQTEVEVRKAKYSGTSGDGSANIFADEKTTISNCKNIIAGLEEIYAN